MTPNDSRAARAKAREERRKLVSQLRRQSTGLIAPSKQESASRKTRLDEVHDDDDDDSDVQQNETSSSQNTQQKDDEDDSHVSKESREGNSEEESDDEVEEVQGSDARHMAAAMATKNDGLHDILAKKPKKRKRKPKGEVLDTFDDEFFARLEAEKLASEAAARTAAAQPKGRRTTFVVDDDDDDKERMTVHHHDHNIQVVVMNESSKPVEVPPPSAELLAYSKVTLRNGMLPATRKRPAQATWKRSKTVLNRKRKVRNKMGHAAINFVSQK